MLKDDFKGFLFSRGVLYAALLTSLAAAIAANYHCHDLSERVDTLEEFLFLEYRYDTENKFTGRGDAGAQVATTDTRVEEVARDQPTPAG